MKKSFLKKLSISIIALLISFSFVVPKVFAATGGGTATIGVDGGVQGGNVTVVQSTTHTFSTVLTIPAAGMTLGAGSPTFTIPTGFTAPTTHSVATAGLVLVDGQWSVAASGGGCAVDSSPLSSTTVASGQVITVDVTADCAAGNTITLTYKGTSAISMGATALTISTADAGDPGPVTALIAGSPTITVTAAAPTPTPTPTPSPTPVPGSTTNSTSSSSSTSSDGSSSSVGSTNCPALNYVSPNIITSKRIDSNSIFVNWGPYSGGDTFIIEYGPTNGNWLYNTKVTGFSTTINQLSLNQPIWVRVAATDGCSIGSYGQAKLVGGPSLPDTGFAPKNTISRHIISAEIFLLSFFYTRVF